MNIVCGDYGYITPANRVKLRHAGGIETWYWHLKRDSVLVAVGQRVTCGQPLGLVGSSGNSSQPHLHFEVADSSGATIDPYAGVLSQPDSYWVEQDAGDGLPGAACPAP
jgi:murein DD-endopeptidase MepM/ murein hydrolase activator NlpD